MDEAPHGSEPTPQAEPAPPTEVVQTIQRRLWIRGIVIVTAVVVVLVAAGWLVGSIAANA